MTENQLKKYVWRSGILQGGINHIKLVAQMDVPDEIKLIEIRRALAQIEKKLGDKQ